jgi:hypothetical protein
MAWVSSLPIEPVLRMLPNGGSPLSIIHFAELSRKIYRYNKYFGEHGKAG